jgi:hypothetical protein
MTGQDNIGYMLLIGGRQKDICNGGEQENGYEKKRFFREQEMWAPRHSAITSLLGRNKRKSGREAHHKHSDDWRFGEACKYEHRR